MKYKKYLNFFRITDSDRGYLQRYQQLYYKDMFKLRLKEPKQENIDILNKLVQPYIPNMVNVTYGIDGFNYKTWVAIEGENEVYRYIWNDREKLLNLDYLKEIYNDHKNREGILDLKLFMNDLKYYQRGGKCEDHETDSKGKFFELELEMVFDFYQLTNQLSLFITSCGDSAEELSKEDIVRWHTEAMQYCVKSIINDPTYFFYRLHTDNVGMTEENSIKLGYIRVEGESPLVNARYFASDYEQYLKPKDLSKIISFLNDFHSDGLVDWSQLMYIADGGEARCYNPYQLIPSKSSLNFLLQPLSDFEAKFSISEEVYKRTSLKDFDVDEFKVGLLRSQYVVVKAEEKPEVFNSDKNIYKFIKDKINSSLLYTQIDYSPYYIILSANYIYGSGELCVRIYCRQDSSVYLMEVMDINDSVIKPSPLFIGSFYIGIPYTDKIQELGGDLSGVLEATQTTLVNNREIIDSLIGTILDLEASQNEDGSQEEGNDYPDDMLA